MEPSPPRIAVYQEIGKQRIFAGAMDWPGWCRSGRDEGAALDALAEYGARYGQALRGARLGFRAPAEAAVFSVVERLKGNATTDFGAPGIPPSPDAQPMDPEDLRRSLAILKACWRAFDKAVVTATGRDLRKGPRGGGRELEEIARHVLDADAGYLRSLGWAFKPDEKSEYAVERERTRRATCDALAAAARGELARRGPRGGLRWTPRYFVRRVAWHVLDHAWEIEDRAD